MSTERTKSKANAKSLKGIIEGIERRRDFLIADIPRAREDGANEGTLLAMRVELMAMEGAIERLQAPTLPESPPFEAPPSVVDEWRQAASWPADRQMALLAGVLARLGESPSMEGHICNAFRAVHYDVRCAMRGREPARPS